MAGGFGAPVTLGLLHRLGGVGTARGFAGPVTLGLLHRLGSDLAATETNAGTGGWGAGLHGPPTPLSKVNRKLSDLDDPLFTVEEVLEARPAEVLTPQPPLSAAGGFYPKAATDSAALAGIRAQIVQARGEIERAEMLAAWRRFLDDDDDDVLLLM